jgi:hypothetical protein
VCFTSSRAKQVTISLKRSNRREVSIHAWRVSALMALRMHRRPPSVPWSIDTTSLLTFFPLVFKPAALAEMSTALA